MCRSGAPDDAPDAISTGEPRTDGPRCRRARRSSRRELFHLAIVNRTIHRRTLDRRFLSSEPDSERRYDTRARPETNPRRVTGTDGGGATTFGGRQSQTPATATRCRPIGRAAMSSSPPGVRLAIVNRTRSCRRWGRHPASSSRRSGAPGELSSRGIIGRPAHASGTRPPPNYGGAEHRLGDQT